MVIFSALESMLPIILLIILGYVLRKAGWLGDTFAPSASRLIMNVALPASIFTSVLKNLTLKTLLSLDSGLVVCFASVAICYLVALATVVLLKVRPGRRGVMVNTFANANTIFIGMPLNVALFGEGAVGFFLVYYITNTVSTWAVGTFLIDADPMVKAEGSEPSAQRRRGIDIKRLLPPPLIGFLVALVFLLLQLPVPSFVESTLTYTGNLVTPLSLIYIGIVLKESGLTSVRMDRDTVVALVGKFAIAPLSMVGVLAAYAALFGALPATEAHTFIIQAAVPALTVLPILANEGKGDVRFATNVVVTSTLLCAVVVPIVYALLG